MNLLFLTYQGDMAGSTNSIIYLTTGLAERGHRVVVGCRKESLLYKSLQNTKVVLVAMTFRSKVSSESMQQIKEIVQKFDIQLLNAQSSKDRYLSILAKWRYKLPVKIIHTRRQTPKSIGGFLQNWFYTKGTDKIVVVSHQLKKTFIEKGIPETHLYVIHNGIPSEKFEQTSKEKIAALREKFSIKSSDQVIGCVSRLKKQEQLIRALPLLDASIKVLLVGIEESIFDDLKKELNIKNDIYYAGKVSSEDVMNYYALMDVHILPSTMDGFGLVLVEAMGMGIPVIGTRYEGIVDVLDRQRNGLWFEDGNIEELAEKIRMILYNNEVRKTLINNGYEAATKRFTTQQTILNYEAFFEEIIAEK